MHIALLSSWQDGLQLTTVELLWRLSAHPLTTAGIFLALYLILEFIRDRMQCNDCGPPLDSI